ncbi:MAG: VanZ like family [Bacteroidota bacterium]
MTSSFRNKQIFRAAQWIWAAFVFIIHVAPVDPERVSRFDFPFADKWIHGILFFLLAGVSFLARESKRNMRVSVLIILVACACYGALLEWIQLSFTDERSGDVMDWFADISGTLLGLLTARVLEPLLTRRS